MLNQFIIDLSNNQTIAKFLPSIGPEQWELLKKEAAIDNSHIWTEHAPPSGWDDIKSGVKVSRYNGDDGIYQPTKILPLASGSYLVLQYNKEVAQFSASWNFEGYLPYGQWAIPSSAPDAYQRLYGGALNSDESKLALCSYSYHTVRVFNHNTGDVLWTFGDGTAGSPGDGHLYNPRDAAWLPNGNLLVTCYSGIGSAGATNYGYVVELDGTDGSLVAVRLEASNINHGRMNRGGCYYPTGMAVIDNHVYICATGTDEVGVFDVSTGFDFVRVYKRPSGVDADAKDQQCISNGPNNTILVNSNTAKIIAALDKSTGDFEWYTGMPGWDAKAHPHNQPHELNVVYGMIYNAAEDMIYAADYANDRIMALTTSNLHTIQYAVNPPAGYELASYPPGYDHDTHQVSIQVNKVSEFGYSCGKPGYLVLGWKKICV